ncbi:Putative sterigmatocystin biosynthesis polyketide synthase [Fulvia fulva]|nr:putative sterigmatocystin biosynthesis polyketide synthase [Fulvia fulva]KAK4620330.1 putative sterigmatocystin biosynthesis polyketide synthase [Fulvia fulva]WPV17167.1 Putative sterigmatocystin biosynthesis polyketide synthase [Fulvia fulva]WPV32662.1 Putative sterigmatocystin biosynthesis polyketide synthase [Fulvia fulva]
MPVPAPAPAVAKHVPTLESSSIHKVVSEVNTATGLELIVETDVCRPDIMPMMEGHKVDAVGLCTPSVYADITFTIGNYILDKYNPPGPERIVDVGNMRIEKPLIPASRKIHSLQTCVQLDWVTKYAKALYKTVDENGVEIVKHATAGLSFRTNDHSQSLEGAPIKAAKTRYSEMRQDCLTGSTYRFNSDMAYNMISALADFHEDYGCIDETIYSDSTWEASATVSFAQMKQGGTFHTHPGAIDGFTQSAGFTMNANETVDLDKDIYVNHGWDSFHVYGPVRHDCSYGTTSSEDRVPSATPKSRIPEALAIVSEQSGVPIAELQDDTVLADIGVDSLLTLTITGAFADHFDIEADTSFFDDHPTIADVKRFFAAKDEEYAIPTTETAAPQPVAHQAPLSMASMQSSASPSSHNGPQPVAPAPASVAAPMPMQSVSAGSERHKQLLTILSEESALSLDDLTDDHNLLDAGVDSLLSLVIGGRLREEMDLDIDTESLISTCGTVGNLKSALGLDAPTPDIAQPLTPVAAPVCSPPALPPPTQKIRLNPMATPIQKDSMYPRALEILCEETQILLADLTEDTILSDVGIDSLLSLVVTSRFRDELEIELDADEFANFTTMHDMKDWLTGRNTSTPSASTTSSRPTSFDGNTPSAGCTPLTATSVALQGTTKTAARSLCLFPDGSGSATSYVSLPRVAPDLIVYGLNPPFLKDATAMSNFSFDNICQAFITGIRRRQPMGPYDFAGWSAGGALAFRSAQIMHSQGDKINTLALVDAPVPKGLGELPQRLYDYLSSFGVFSPPSKKSNSSDKTPPEWLIPHFKAMTKALHTYHAAFLPSGAIPNVSILWAGRSIIDSVGAAPFQLEPGDSPDGGFLTETRKDFGPGGWGALLPGSNVRCGKVENADYFEMMRLHWAQHVSTRFAEGLR